MDAMELVDDGTMGVAEARKFSGLSRTYLYQLMESGKLKYAKVGKRRLIPRAELRRLLAECLMAPDDMEAAPPVKQLIVTRRRGQRSPQT